MMTSFSHIARLATAGILALPAIALLVAVAPCVIILSIPSLIILVRRKHRFLSSRPLCARSSKEVNFQHSDANASDTQSNPLLQHAIITGGSSGIGLSIACELGRKNCRNITLLARKDGQLKEAKELVERTARDSSNGEKTAINVSVRTFPVDVTDFVALEKVAAKLCTGNDQVSATKSSSTDRKYSAKAEENERKDENSDHNPGPPTLLFNCAGYAIPRSFADLSATDFQSQVNVNYLGSVYVVKAFLPYMTRQQKRNNSTEGGYGNIILTSSMSGQVGSYGYSAYSPTKFALRGFAECLSMELAAMSAKKNGSCSVNVSLAYPPDTNTPGYEVENLKKPEACRLLSESGGVWDPADVGKKITNEALQPNPPFDIYFGIDGWMLSTLTAGMNPVMGVFDAVWQVSLMGLLRFVSLFYLMDFGRLTQNCYAFKVEEIESDGNSGGSNANVDAKKE
mmetsp:Transcript_27969/g.57078  ORF Transcript_27969/g.57078 Transcript_27969/m.57078 type:complete len:455 (+) Transcript_27969:146-1510(+)